MIKKESRIASTLLSMYPQTHTPINIYIIHQAEQKIKP